MNRHAGDIPADRVGTFLYIAALAALLATIGSLLFPFLEPGFRLGHDIVPHIIYVYVFDRALHQGQFPVRWIETLNNGWSQPLFNFYQVGFYYLVEFVHLVVPRLSRSFTLTVAFSWWMGTTFVFLTFKRLGWLPAAFAAFTFAFAPYVIQDVYVRAAFPEFVAIMFAAGVLWAIDRFLTTGLLVFLAALVCLLAMTLLCHLPTAVIMTPLFGAYALFLLLTRQTTRLRLFMLGPACLAAAGLAAFYVLPALIELHLVDIAKLTSGTFDYRNNFLGLREFDGMPARGPSDTLTFQIAVSQWAVLSVAGLQIVRAWRQKRFAVQTRGLILWSTLALFAVFMTTAASRRIWEIVPVLSFVQFPFRFLMLFSVACAALGATLLSMLGRRVLQALVVFAVLGLHLQIYYRYQRPERLLPIEAMNIDDPAWRDTPKAMRVAWAETAYNPAGVTVLVPPGLGRWTIAQGEGTIDERVMRDDRLVLDAQTESGMQLTVNSHYFPGWHVRMDGRDAGAAARPGDGFMEILVPPGRHHLEAEFEDTPIRTAANAITVASAGLFALSLGALGFSKRLRQAL